MIFENSFLLNEPSYLRYIFVTARLNRFFKLDNSRCAPCLRLSDRPSWKPALLTIRNCKCLVSQCSALSSTRHVYSSACVRSFQVSPTDQLVQLQKETHLQGNKTSEILRPNQLKNIECPALPGRSLTASCAKSPYSWPLPAQDCLERLLGLACCTIRSEEPTRSIHCL